LFQRRDGRVEDDDLDAAGLGDALGRLVDLPVQGDQRQPAFAQRELLLELLPGVRGCRPGGCPGRAA
jgi:hypothetical protein